MIISHRNHKVGAVSRGNELKLWDADTGRLIHAFEDHPEPLTAVAFSPDGTRLLSGSEDGKLRLWDNATGQLLRTVTAHRSDGVRSAAFSPDGAQVLSTGRSDDHFMVKLWDAATGALLGRLAEHSPFEFLVEASSVAFSSDGTQVLLGGTTLRLWDLATARLVRRFA